MGNHSHSSCLVPEARQPWNHHGSGEVQTEDRVEHRLHCHADHCVQCRCDSGSTIAPCLQLPGSTYFDNRKGINHTVNLRHHRRHLSEAHHLQGKSSDQNSKRSSSLQCQYCCVSTFCSSSDSEPSVPPSSVSPSSCPADKPCYCTYNARKNTTATSTSKCRCTGNGSLANILQSCLLPFSGRLCQPHRRRLLSSSSFLHGWQRRMASLFCTVITIATFCLSFLPITDACSSRSTPKPRPPNPTLRPNITIDTFSCPEEYEKHYCLNSAKCFVVKIGEAILYNCECAEGYMGQRCEFKDLDGSYLPSKQRAMLEQAGLTSTAAICVVLVVIVCFYLYVRSKRKSELSQQHSQDVPDGMEYGDFENERLPFSSYYYHSPPPPCLNHHEQQGQHYSFHAAANKIQPPTLPHSEQHPKFPVSDHCVPPAAEQAVSPTTTLISSPSEAYHTKPAKPPLHHPSP